MFNKRKMSYAGMLMGLLITLVGVYLMIKNPFFAYTGLILGIGVALFGISFANIFENWYAKKNPGLVKEKNIAMNDERNKLIKYKTESQIYTIDTYALVIIMIASVGLGAPSWFILLLAGIMVSNVILYVLLFNKNYK